jgi:adenosylcobyric acid synthase
MAKALMIQGTGSGAGKSAIVAGLCRIFRDMGIRVAPFKAQNMALNSFITKEGGEIGRAQAFQAEAAGIEPCNDMNPVLLKATGEAVSQVIFNGKVYKTMKAEEYYAIKDRAWDVVTAAYDRLSEMYDLILIEGAGSPAEIKLQKEEIVNMRVARYTNAPVILVGDIDKGGVFASLYGTVELLRDSIIPPHIYEGNSNTPRQCVTDADYIKGFIINKFRGNIDILRPGLRMIERKTDKLVIGVIPHNGNLGLDEEDGLSIEQLARFKYSEPNHQIKIVVPRLKYISNFTDFAPFVYEPDIEFKYSLWHEDINNADLIIIPGSKNTVSDLLFLRENGLENALKSAVKKGTPMVGICGGYQMLGSKIIDPHSVESNLREVDGIGLLDTVTTLDSTKTTCQVSAELIHSSKLFNMDQSGSSAEMKNLKGYEIHMGNTTGDVGLFKINRFNRVNPSGGANDIPDGSAKGNVWGTYIHGIFDNDEFRRMFLNTLREKKGLPLQKNMINYQTKKQEAIDAWADTLKSKVDICFILRQLGMESFQKLNCTTMRHE